MLENCHYALIVFCSSTLFPLYLGMKVYQVKQINFVNEFLNKTTIKNNCKFETS